MEKMVANLDMKIVNMKENLITLIEENGCLKKKLEKAEHQEVSVEGKGDDNNNVIL